MADKEFQDLKQRSLFARLKKLFSNDVVVRNIGGKKLKIVDTNSIMYSTEKGAGRDRFSRIRASGLNQTSKDFSLAYQTSRIELFREYDCISGDTVIPTPDGNRYTIRELTDKYINKSDIFYVFSYDHNTNSIKLGEAFNPRSKGIQKTYKVNLDKGKFVIATADHLFMKRDGTYVKLKDLNKGDSLMPFYQKDFYKSGYRSIYNFSKKWQSEHVLVAEQFECELKMNEVVHHKDFNKCNNLPGNLQIMTDSAHKSYHCNINNKILWSPENRSRQIAAIREGNKHKPVYSWNGKRKGKNNPFYGKQHTLECNIRRGNSIKEWHTTKDFSGKNNPNYRSDISYDVIRDVSYEYFRNNQELTVKGVLSVLDCSHQILLDRLEENNINWLSFKHNITNTLNHKVESIELYGEIEVFDLSVKEYNNFATDTVFIHNCMEQDSIISAALNIYADECVTMNEMGETIIIKSADDNIKDILDNLFYDILNIEFNLWSWTRNLIKYGDFYLRLHISPEFGIYLVEPLSPYNVTRVENSRLENKNYVKFQVNVPEGGKIDDLENYQMAHFRLLSDSNMLPYGRSTLEGARRSWKQLCLHENSNVWTPTGYIKIKDIKRGDLIYSYDYKNNKIIETTVKHHLYTGNREVYKIRSAHRTIFATAEHPILVTNGKYKTVDELTTQDYIVIGNQAISPAKIKLPPLELPDSELVCKFTDLFFESECINKNQTCLECKTDFGRLNGMHLQTHNMTVSDYYKKHDINENFAKLLYNNGKIPLIDGVLICKKLNISIDNLEIYYKRCKNPIVSKSKIMENLPLFLRFFGFMLGDGWSLENCICFSIGNRLDKSSKYIELLNNLNVSYGIRNQNEFSADCVVSSAYLSNLFSKNLEFRTGTSNKILPQWVFELPLDLKREVLYGFADADGCSVSGDRFCVSGINKELLESFHVLAQQSGFTTSNLRCGVPKIDLTNEFKKNAKPVFSFEFGNSKYHAVLDENGIYSEKILEIEKQTEFANVYDIEVDHDLHNFIADGVNVSNCLLEDSMMIHRIMRAPEKRIFKIDVGNIPPQEVDGFMEKIMNKTKKIPYINEQTGDYNLKFNLQNMVEDFYLPVRGGDSGTTIDTLSGMEFTGIDDIEYIKHKMLAALMIPKPYLTFDEDTSGKATLSQEDLRFAKTITRIQKYIVSELTKIATIHLYSQGYRDESLVDFSLSLVNPSTIFEKEKIAIWSDKVAVANDMMESKLFSKSWIYQNVFNLSDDSVDVVKNETIEDVKQSYRYKQIEEEGNDPAKPFEKIKTADSTPSGGADSMGDMGNPPSENKPEGNEPPPTEAPPEASTKPSTETKPTVKEYVRPSQAGVKKARDYPFGEDPLGNLENNRKTKVDPIRHRFKNNSPMSLESINSVNGGVSQRKNIMDDLIGLDQYCELNNSKELLTENLPSTSYLDVGNIKEE